MKTFIYILIAAVVIFFTYKFIKGKNTGTVIAATDEVDTIVGGSFTKDGSPVESNPTSITSDSVASSGVASGDKPVSNEAVATGIYQKLVTDIPASLIAEDPHGTAMEAAKGAGVTLNAPTAGGTVSILVNESKYVGEQAQVKNVVFTPQQAADYNESLAKGYTPFQAAALATSWTYDVVPYQSPKTAAEYAANNAAIQAANDAARKAMGY